MKSMARKAPILIGLSQNVEMYSTGSTGIGLQVPVTPTMPACATEYVIRSRVSIVQRSPCFPIRPPLSKAEPARKRSTSGVWYRPSKDSRLASESPMRTALNGRRSSRAFLTGDINLSQNRISRDLHHEAEFECE